MAVLALPEAYPRNEAESKPWRFTNDIVRDNLSPLLAELEKACVVGDLVKVTSCHRRGADLDEALDMEGSTALMIACRTGNDKLVAHLVETACVDLDGPTSRSGLRAIDIAARGHFRAASGNSTIVEYMKSKGALFTWWGACFGADVERLQEYLDNGQDVNEVNPCLYNFNAVECALSSGHMKVAEWLVSQGGYLAVRNCNAPYVEEMLWDIGRTTAFYYREIGIE